MDVEQLQTELLDSGQDPVQRRLIGQRPGEHGLTSLHLRVQTLECAEQRVAQEPADAELVVHRPCRLFHGASVGAERVREHRTDRVRDCRSTTAPSSPRPSPHERRDRPALSKRTADATTGCVLDIAPSRRPLGPGRFSRTV